MKDPVHISYTYCTQTNSYRSWLSFNWPPSMHTTHWAEFSAGLQQNRVRHCGFLQVGYLFWYSERPTLAW